jgi:hypothetical protein
VRLEHHDFFTSPDVLKSEASDSSSNEILLSVRGPDHPSVQMAVGAALFSCIGPVDLLEDSTGMNSAAPLFSQQFAATPYQEICN